MESKDRTGIEPGYSIRTDQSGDKFELDASDDPPSDTTLIIDDPSSGPQLIRSKFSIIISVYYLRGAKQIRFPVFPPNARN